MRTAERIYSSASGNLCTKDDFFRVNNAESLIHAQAVLKNRILGYHLSQGVQILDLVNTNIDADVQIAPDVIVYPFNTILGRSSIGKNTILYPNNTIIDSGIGDNCKIYNSVIERSKIRDNSRIEPFSYVKNGEIK